MIRARSLCIRHPGRVLRGLAAAALTWTAASAQSPLSSAEDCLAHLPPNVFTRVAVYLEATADSQSRKMLPHVDLFTQAVAIRLRSTLGAEGSALPPADSVLTWRQLGPPLVVIAHRDGRLAWAPDMERDQPHLEPSVALLERTLITLRDEGERIFFPQDFEVDSVTFRISYRWPLPLPHGGVESMPVRLAIPVFSLNVPWHKPALALEKRRPKYPNEPLGGRAEGRVLLQFIVDTNGRAEMHTLRELLRPRDLSDELEAYYQAFVKAAIDWVKDAKFSPAEIGGCRVRQLVQLPFAFKLRG